MIGGATALGWGGDTPLTSSAFNKSQMTFTGSDIVLRVGEFKIRNSGGWKLWLNEAGDMKVNTNYGYRLDSLVRGGSNIQNTVAGIYNFTFTWNSQTGSIATAVKTADLPLTNWTGVELDIVGSGVSADNATAIPDPSSWNWGNVIYPVPNEPTINGNVYTWTWNDVVFEAGEGFKVRTKNGVAPAQNGANFDAGFGSVNVASSSNKVVDNGGNISVNEKGAFNVVITIDANNDDAKSIVITEAKLISLQL